jgi:predicted nucleotidyltransferase
MENKYQSYKKSWDLDAVEQAAVCEEKRLCALDRAKTYAMILVEKFGAKRVVLFGSAIAPGRFNNHSDLDLAVEGLPASQYFAALGELIRTSPVAIDLVPIEDANALLKERIEKGVVLYE